MRPRMSASPPPISVGGDEDNEDGANGAEKEDFVDSAIGRSLGQHTSA